MKTVKPIFIFLLTLIISGYAEMTLEWEKDLSAQGFDSYPQHLIHQLCDKGILVVMMSGNGYSEDNDAEILIYNPDGTLRYHDAFSTSSAGIISVVDWPPFNLGGFAVIKYQYNAALIKYQYQFRVYERQAATYSIYESPVCDSYDVDYTTIGQDSLAFITLEGAMLRKYRINTQPSEQNVILTSGVDGPNYVLSWPSILGTAYQIQSSTNLEDWADVGVPITGTGSPISWANSIVGTKCFFRVVEE